MEPTLLAKLILTLPFLGTITLSFNLDTRFPLIFSDNAPQESYFGYSVGLLRNDEGQWLLAGAPRANSTDFRRRGIVEPGVIYKCSVNSKTSCTEIPFHLAGQGAVVSSPYNYDEMWDNSWLGGSLDVSTNVDTFVMVCSHLWKNKYDPKNYLTNGMCIVADSSLQKDNFLRLTPLTVAEHQTQVNDDGEDIYKYGFGLAGFSSQFLPNSKDIVLGAPGVVDWKGTIISADENGYRKKRSSQRFQIPKPLDSISPNSYFGYSVSSGSFFSLFKTELVAGAPRDGPAGKVYIVDTPAIHDKGFIIRSEKEGQQMGEYFGGSVCAVDINNDHFDELLVGAPFHSVIRDEGKVYVYLNNREGHSLTPLEPLTGSLAISARFGSAIAAIGDLNQDGYIDVAVGAPYEEGVGAIYIYFGSLQGLKLKQKILATTIDSKLRGFGISISRGSDVDENHYIDLAIGAYESNSAVILRSHPVLNMKYDIQFGIEQINMHHATCFLNRIPTVCFTITACMSYSSENGPNTLDVENMLTIGEQNSKEKRAFLKSGNDEVTNVKYRLQLLKDNTNCEEFEAHVLNSTVDYLTPVKFSLRAALINDPFTSSVFCGNCPVIPPDNEPVFVKSLPFATNCGMDDVCISDLSVTAKIRGQSDKSAFVIGSYDSITLSVEIKNSGEPAYQAKAVILLPRYVMLASKPDYCIISNLLFVCDVGNPLRHNRVASVDVVLDIGQLPTSETELRFEVHVNTTSKELNSKDKAIEIVLPLISDGDIVVIGDTTDEQILLQPDNNKTKKENTTNIVHKFKVLKKGYTPIHSVSLTITLPVLLPDEMEPFLQLKSVTVPPSSSKGVSFHEECTINQTSSNNLHENVEFPSSTSGNFVLQCSGNLCYVIRCTMGPFLDQDNAIISLELEVKTELLKKLLNKHQFIDLVSKGSIKIHDRGFQQAPNHHPDFAQVITQFVKSGSPAAKQIEVWIIIVCILVGILLLIIIALILAKIGFFRRKEKEEMEKLTSEDKLLDNNMTQTTEDYEHS